jgi:hypothetical protein
MPIFTFLADAFTNFGVNRMTRHSRYQQNIIRNYYENRDSIALQRVQELVTELYLSEGKARERHWKTLAGHLEKLGVAPATIAHLREQDKPELVAGLVTKLGKGDNP